MGGIAHELCECLLLVPNLLLVMAIVPTYPITGIRVGLDPGERVPLRQEIDAWFDSIKPTDKMQVQLFIFALKHFQEMDPVDRLSYFQIAGCKSTSISSERRSDDNMH